MGNVSEHLWENDLGEIHTISQGEGGEQGGRNGAIVVFPSGKLRALEDVARHLWPGETPFRVPR